MNIKANQAAIVAALRSGKYTQGNGALNEKGCHCVWGVICDVSGQDEWVESAGTPGAYKYGMGGDICFPGQNVKNWAGMSAFTTVRISGHVTDLMSHNDTGASFEQLADAIESQIVKENA